jgi:hypothetical protein
LPAKDRHHDSVKEALVKSGWIITHDPRTLLLPERVLFVDFRVVNDQDQSALLIEVKGFEQSSQVEALMAALGKYNVYRSAMKYNDIIEPLYLAIPEAAYLGIMSETLGREILRDYEVKLLVFDPEKREIVRWNP